jgi:cytoskeletal protein CcmA (bactofilin family)
LTRKRKIKKGRLFGVPQLNDNYLTGEIIADETINPKIFNETLFRSLFEHITDNESVGDEVYKISELTINKLKNINFQIPNDISIEGFLEKGNELETLNVYVKGKTHFSNETKSTYNLQINCDSTISIGENVHIENAVLVSQTSIDVGSNCSFKNVQLFAKDSITISDSEFLFPSVIGLYVETDGKNRYENKIDISSSVINGTVMLVSSIVGLDENKSKIKIDEESMVQGLVYSENNLELYGEVKGCVYTYNFLYMDGKKEYNCKA